MTLTIEQLKSLGKHAAGLVTISTITPIGESGKVNFVQLEGYPEACKIKCWTSEGLKSGDQVDAIIECKNDREGKIERFLSKVKPAGKGGGGFKSQPKSEAAIMAQVALKEAGEIARLLMSNGQPFDEREFLELVAVMVTAQIDAEKRLRSAGVNSA